MELAAGTIASYDVLGEVGRGGMATVLLARHRTIGRLVALKRLDGLRAATDESFSRRFLREGQLAGALNHPNVVTVYDYFEHEDTPYIAMEYLHRGSLRPYVGRLTYPQIAGVLEGVLAGLAHAEKHGIVHRDIKPENLMLADDGQIKITDFGISTVTGALNKSTTLTATGVTIGTPKYMAPEQAMAKGLGPWTDLYTVGVVAFEMLVGHVPFEDEAPTAILLHHVNDPIPPVDTLDPTIDAGTSAWVESMLAKKPQDRFQSAAEAWDALEEIVVGRLGPRWQRDARLLDLPDETPPTLKKPPARTHPPTRRLPPTRTRAAAPPGEMGAAAALAETRAPRRPRSAAERSARAPTRALWPRVAMLAGVLVALLAALATASSLFTGPSSTNRGSGGSARQAAADSAAQQPGATQPAGTGGPARTAGAGQNASPSSPSAGAGQNGASTAAAAQDAAENGAGPGFALALPPGWGKQRDVPSTGLPLQQATAWAPQGGAGGQSVVEGRLPADSVAALTPPPGASRTAIDLPGASGFPAWRYTGIANPNNQKMTLYVVSEARDAAAVACTASQPTCDGIADTLQVTDPNAKPPAASQVAPAPSAGAGQGGSAPRPASPPPPSSSGCSGDSQAGDGQSGAGCNP